MLIGWAGVEVWLVRTSLSIGPKAEIFILFSFGISDVFSHAEESQLLPGSITRYRYS